VKTERVFSLCVCVCVCEKNECLHFFVDQSSIKERTHHHHPKFGNECKILWECMLHFLQFYSARAQFKFFQFYNIQASLLVWNCCTSSIKNSAEAYKEWHFIRAGDISAQQPWKSSLNFLGLAFTFSASTESRRNWIAKKPVLMNCDEIQMFHSQPLSGGGVHIRICKRSMYLSVDRWKVAGFKANSGESFWGTKISTLCYPFTGFKPIKIIGAWK
jgi:hypothetical protein